MKVQIRRGIFETNSSSVHTLTLASGAEFQKWKDGELLFCSGMNKFLDPEAGYKHNREYAKKCAKYFGDLDMDVSDEKLTEQIIEKWGEESEIYITYDQYRAWREGNYEFETFEEHQMISGVDIVAFGYYGQD